MAAAGEGTIMDCGEHQRAAPISIGFAGVAGAGKTTAARAAVSALRESPPEGYSADGVRLVGFADPLRRGIGAMGIDRGRSPDLFRAVAERLGETIRASEPDWFVENFVAANDRPGRINVVHDVRFPGEWGVLDAVFYVAPWGTLYRGPRGDYETDEMNRGMLLPTLEATALLRSDIPRMPTVLPGTLELVSAPRVGCISGVVPSTGSGWRDFRAMANYFTDDSEVRSAGLASVGRDVGAIVRRMVGDRRAAA